MTILLVVILLLILFGGGYVGHTGGYFGGHPAYYGGFGLGTVLIIILVIWLLRGGL